MAPSVPTTAKYRQQSVRFLQNHYRGIACLTISSLFSSNDYHFTSTFEVLSHVRDEDDATIQRLQASQPGLKIFIKTERKAKRVRVTDRALLDKIESIPELNLKRAPAAVALAAEGDDGDDDDVSIINLVDDSSVESVDNDGAGLKQIECGCCFGEYPPESMDECSALGGHQCCRDCLRRFVSEQLDGQNRTDFNCIVNADCRGSYSMFQLSKILSPRTNQRLNDVAFRAGVEASGMVAWTCNRCNHVGFLEEPLPPTVYCSSDQCRLAEYCRLCKYPWHQGQTCQESEAERERLKDPVLRAQEAMTAATVRKCPRCATPFEKRDGCNKMTCSKCRCISCYLCKQSIEGYAHFCSKHGCKCGQCHLWADPKESDERARREAGRKVLADTNMSDADIKRILASTSPPQMPPAVATPPVAAAAAAAGVALDQPPPAIVARAEPQQADAVADEAAAAANAMNWERFLVDIQGRRLEFQALMAEEQRRLADERRRRAQEIRHQAEEIRRREEQQQMDANEDPMAQLNLWLARFRFGERGDRLDGP